MTNLSCLGCSPGKSPFRARTGFPLQSGQGLGAAGPKYLFGHIPIRVTHLPNLSCSGISRGNSPFGAFTRFSLQSGQGVEAAAPKYLFGCVPIWPNPSPLTQGCSTAVALYSFPRNTPFSLHGPSRTTPWPHPPGVGWGLIVPNYLCGQVPMRVKHLPSFSSVSPGTTAADLPLALGRCAGPLGEVLGLIWPDPPLLYLGCSSTFVLWSFPRNPRCRLHGPPEPLFRLPPPRRRGPAGPNLGKEALGVEPQLGAKFQAPSPDNGCQQQTYIRTCTHTLPFI